MSGPQNIQIAAANQSVNSASHAGDIITDIENVPVVKQGIQTTIGPYIRKYGSSPFFCMGTYLITVKAKQYFNIDLDQQTTQYIAAIMGVAAAYLWQTISMAWGKYRAPVQPNKG